MHQTLPVLSMQPGRAPSLVSASLTSLPSTRRARLTSSTGNLLAPFGKGWKLPTIAPEKKKKRNQYDGVRPLYMSRPKQNPPPGLTVEIRYGYYASLLHKHKMLFQTDNTDRLVPSNLPATPTKRNSSNKSVRLLVPSSSANKPRTSDEVMKSQLKRMARRKN